MIKFLKRALLNLFASKVLDENYLLRKKVEEYESKTPDTQVQVVTRLNRDVYTKFRSSLPNLKVSDTTSKEMVGVKLGVAQVLEAMERDLVV